MITEQTTITYLPVPSSEIPGNWLNLEQPAVPLSQRNATLADMVQMFNRALSGLSARTYQLDKCSAATIKSGGTVVVTLAVRVWPSALDLPYVLTASHGMVDAGQPLEVEREIDVAVEGTDAVTLPWLVGAPLAWWQIPCVNEFSEPVPEPAITVAGAGVKLADSCYGVLRIRGLARGYRHILTMEFVKPTQSSLTNIKVSVTATYTDTNGEQQAEILALTIPACVLDLLEYCEGDVLATDPRTELVILNDDPIPTVYYDTCTGQVIELRYE